MNCFNVHICCSNPNGGLFGGTEFVKTQMQLQARVKGVNGTTVAVLGPIDVARETIRKNGIFGLYRYIRRLKSEQEARRRPWMVLEVIRMFVALPRGLNTLVIGTFFKNAVRFAAFNQFRSMLQDDQGKLTPGRSAVVWPPVSSS